MTIANLFKSFLRPLVPPRVRRRLGRLLAARRPAQSPAIEPGYPDWGRWVRQDARLWNRALRQARRGPAVLLATSLGGYTPGLIFESVLGAALTLRGASVRFLLCDKVLPGCQKAHPLTATPEALARYELKTILCDSCLRRGEAVLAG